MTNLERWMLYNKDVSSPETFIKWSWYYTISAALQRRVWMMDRPIFPNLYVVLVGPAALGKGLVIGPINDMLQHWPYREESKEPAPAGGLSAADMEELNQSRAGVPGQKTKERMLLINTASSATTYEALVRHMAVSTRTHSYTEDGKQKFYAHCSSCFCLEELGSLFRQHSEDVVRFLLETYDCRNYTYDTKTQGKDIIRRCCVSLLAGTTPSFMERCFTDELLSEGFSSRTIFIYESSNRFHKAFIETISSEQEAARQGLLDHIKRLSTLYGKLEVERETIDSMESWWKLEASGIGRANKSPKLDPYYGRKQLHVSKLAMAIHFSESTEMKIPMRAFVEAQRLLAEVEVKMHNAVTLNNKNPLAGVHRDIIKYLVQYGPQSEKELIMQFYGASQTGVTGIKEVLDVLKATGRIRLEKRGNAWKYEATQP